MKLTRWQMLTLSAQMLLTPLLVQAAGTPVMNFHDAIKNATTSGLFRFGYISVAPDVAGAKTTTAAAFGGQIKLETAPWHRFQFAIAPYFTEKLDMLSGDNAKSELNGDFFNASNDSYAYLGEAYINYAWRSGTARFGRQQINTPFINTDDIRMHPNTFNAAWLNTTLSQKWILNAGVVSRWVGFDAASKDKFVKAKTDGVTAVGIHYSASDSLVAQGWYYDFAKQYGLLYADVTYLQGNTELAAQYARYSEKNASNVAGSVVGLKAAYTLGDFTLSAALNQGSNPTGKSADLGLGGGNFYTSMDENTIGGVNEASAQYFGVTFAANDALSVTLLRGHFENKGKTSTNTDETDLNIGYKLTTQLEAGFTYTMVENKAQPTDSASNFTRHLLRLNYSF